MNNIMIKVTYGKTIKNRIADFMRRVGLIRVSYSVPVLEGDGYRETGSICAISGNKVALWLVSRLFEKEVNIQKFELI